MGVDYYTCSCGRVYSDHNDDRGRCLACEKGVCGKCRVKFEQYGCVNCACPENETIDENDQETYTCNEHDCDCFKHPIDKVVICDICSGDRVSDERLLEFLLGKNKLTKDEAIKEYRNQ